ncbi:unnamed protein product [Acanthoscelides obtectus]|uniref:Uncharacterized protein n=1 Tax=Acanthoscelides obtectus TaxID=200917 RepID=A0A9P0JYC2_ACAOB|nr:unnamed protein product [Acanthoscelides obtectus]CAK1632114.1 hypothetical protein AOBTE_LOCUS7371 [Acanthoscelides obtectus]
MGTFSRSCSFKSAPSSSIRREIVCSDILIVSKLLTLDGTIFMHTPLSIL